MCAEIMDLENCYDAMLSLKTCYQLKIYNKRDYEERMLVLKQFENKVRGQLHEQYLKGRRSDVEDNFSVDNHRL